MKNYINELKDEIRYSRPKIWFDSNLKPFFKLENYKRFFSWVPIIWNDREWDYWFIYKLLRFKLQQNYDFYNSDKPVTIKKHTDKTKKQLFVCINLLDRILDDNYYEGPEKHIAKKYGEYKAYPLPDKNGRKISMITRENLNEDDEEQMNQYHKDSKRMFERIDKQRKQDINYLFDTIKKHITGWWD